MKYIFKEIYKVNYCSLEYTGEDNFDIYVIASSVEEALAESKKALPVFIKDGGHSKDGDWTPVSVEFMFEIITEKEVVKKPYKPKK